mgnify:CR=1 FL=1
MKKLIIVTLMAACCFIPAMAQEPVNGATYFLPKTGVKFKLLIEKSTYTPGEMANYADRYMKLSNVGMQPQTQYRLIRVNIHAIGLPDSTKQFTALIDKKHSIISLDRDENGVLMAVNDKSVRPTPPQPFRPAPKTTPDNPRDFFTEDILAAGNKPRMAELIAQEITDIRESRNLLTRGEAEFMPKDGEQLKIMLATYPPGESLAAGLPRHNASRYAGTRDNVHTTEGRRENACVSFLKTLWPCRSRRSKRQSLLCSSRRPPYRANHKAHDSV